MRISKWTPWVLLGSAILVTVFALFGDNSYAKLRMLRKTLAAQEGKNHELTVQVHDLNREVADLQAGGRALEKAVRNELGMARPNEEIFIFEKGNER